VIITPQPDSANKLAGYLFVVLWVVVLLYAIARGTGHDPLPRPAPQPQQAAQHIANPVHRIAPK